jgi:hypothetical protein
MNKEQKLKESEIEDASRYARLMRGLPINLEKDTGLSEAFSYVDKLESMLDKEYPSANPQGKNKSSKPK